MKKSAPLSKIKESEMQSELTEPEMDAALQLIQLSGDSVETGARTAERTPEGSVGDSNEISSYKIVGEVDALPRNRKRFRSIDDIYSITSPAINKRGKKSAKRWNFLFQFCIYSTKRRRREIQSDYACSCYIFFSFLVSFLLSFFFFF